MSVQLQGVIHGKRIELERETELPAGSIVVVNIHLKLLNLEEKRQLVDLLCGTWADDTSLSAIFAEIEQRRAMTQPRTFSFHAAS